MDARDHEHRDQRAQLGDRTQGSTGTGAANILQNLQTISGLIPAFDIPNNGFRQDWKTLEYSYRDFYNKL